MDTEVKTQKWTPGPWKAQKLLADGLIIRKEGWEISTPHYDVCANIQYGAPIRNEADALLISKSPEMADLLREDAAGRPLHVLLTIAADYMRAHGDGPVADCLRIAADKAEALLSTLEKI